MDAIMNKSTLLFFLCTQYVTVNGTNYFTKHINDGKDDIKINIFADIVLSNLKTNGWNNIIIFGHFPNNLYLKLKTIPFTFVTSNTDDDDFYVEDAVPYHSNTILIKCFDFGNFEESLLQVMSLPYWHPHANVYLYYHAKESKENIARIFFIFWYYRACNVLLVQYNDDDELLLLSQYTPFISPNYEVKNMYGCWTVKKLGMPIYTFEEAFTCEEKCQNVSGSSKLRGTSLGTCLGVITDVVSYNQRNITKALKLFEDKGKNLHGYPFRTFASEVLPFMSILEHPNNTYSLASRDGTIWTTIASLLNFTFDLTPSLTVMKKRFDYEVSIQHIFGVAHRKGDLFVDPIYQFDVIVVEIDYSFPYKDSGVCFVAHRADFQTILFDSKTFLNNYEIILQFDACFLGIWFVFCLYSGTEAKVYNLDFIGKNFLNCVRNVLLINLHNPPKRESFRLFLTITIWSYFIINFSTQAAIVSFFSAFKRGQEVDTFEDIIEKGYKIEGMASPDVVLPETEERFQKINSKLSPVRDIFECVRALRNDSQRFCLIDCSVGRYLETNVRNENGERYLHVAKDRIHSHYLNFIFSKHSVLTDNFNKHLMFFFEAGLIKKWEEYRYAEIKEEVPTKPLDMDNLIGIFNLLAAMLMTTILIFFIELCVGNYNNNKRNKSLGVGCCKKAIIIIK